MVGIACKKNYKLKMSFDIALQLASLLFNAIFATIIKLSRNFVQVFKITCQYQYYVYLMRGSNKKVIFCCYNLSNLAKQMSRNSFYASLPKIIYLIFLLFVSLYALINISKSDFYYFRVIIYCLITYSYWTTEGLVFLIIIWTGFIMR